MKLAEALQRRTDLVRKLDDLKERIRNNALVQDGEQPVEDPKALLKEYDDSVAELGDLISNIPCNRGYSKFQYRQGTECRD